MTIHLYQNDLPGDLPFSSEVAIDTETMGLKPGRDRLCLVQLCFGDGHAHLVQIANGVYDAPNLRRLISDKTITKLFHFARFDIAVLQAYLGVTARPVFCTKIASKLVRTFTDRHGLRDICRDLLNVDISKQQQSSDWGARNLDAAQLEYAASDVLHLHALQTILTDMLKRENRLPLAQACFDFLPDRALLDLAGWEDTDIFAHK